MRKIGLSVENLLTDAFQFSSAFEKILILGGELGTLQKAF